MNIVKFQDKSARIITYYYCLFLTSKYICLTQPCLAYLFDKVIDLNVLQATL